MKRNRFVIGSAFIVIAAALGVSLSTTACGKKKSTSTETVTDLAEGTSIAITGKLAITGTASSLNFDAGTDLTSLSVYCVTFSNPPVAGTGTVAADGSFSLSLAAAQQAVGCFILKGEDQVGTIVFKNPSKKSLSGSSKTEQRQAFGGDTNLGTVSLNLTTGQAEVDVTQIQTKLKDTTSANAAEVAHDFSGSYTLQPVPFTLPKGYMTTCSQGTQDCKGPQAGQGIWLKRVNGKYVADGKPAYGIMIWQSEAAFKACGSRLGISFDEARTKGGVDLSGSGLTEGPFQWASDWGAEGWGDPTATLSWPQMKMEKATVGGYIGQKQWFKQARLRTCSGSTCTTGTADTSITGFSFNAQSDETGCKKDGQPYQLNDWKDMKCEFQALGSGLNKNTCTKTVSGSTVTCVHIGGMFRTDGSALQGSSGSWYEVQFPQDYVVYGTGASCSDGGNPQWSQNGMFCANNATLTPGTKCSEMAPGDTSTSAQLARYRCYAENYWQRAEKAASQGKCVRELKADWMAETPETFVLKNGPVRASGQFIFEGFEYDSANSGSFRSQEKNFEGIQVGNNWDSCEVLTATTFSMRKAPDSANLVVEMIQESRNISMKPACVAYYKEKGGNANVQKMMFIMKKN